jgi:SPP1 family predicted phage head-tail adaptor
MDFSKLKNRITFLKPTNTQNATGENVSSFEEYMTVWSSVVPVTGKEYIESQKLRSETTYKIATRYIAGITTDMKIKYGDKIFEIVSVLNLNERNIELQIVAFEV